MDVWYWSRQTTEHSGELMTTSNKLPSVGFKLDDSYLIVTLLVIIGLGGFKSNATEIQIEQYV